MFRRTTPLLLALLVSACQSSVDDKRRSTPPCPIAGGVPADDLIRDGEKHFKHLWRLTWDGENAEAYWSPDSDRLVFQRRWDEVECDRIFVTGEDGSVLNQISDGRGTTTCSFFLPDGEHVLFGSTGAVHTDCPPKPDHSLGYAWAIYSEFDIYVQNLESGETKPLVSGPGYDTEATVSPQGDRIVFTSTRSGDLELWTCDLEGGDLQQVTDKIGYDGGAFFSHSGEWLVYRTTAFDQEDLAGDHQRYRELLDNDVIRPHSMEIMIVRPDGSERQQVTQLGRANWAPYFFPDDQRIIFCTNHHWNGEGKMNFDLFAINPDGTDLERITFDEDFDSFAMFSPDGKYLAFSSNRGGENPGDTNLFIAEWR